MKGRVVGNLTILFLLLFFASCTRESAEIPESSGVTVDYNETAAPELFSPSVAPKTPIEQLETAIPSETSELPEAVDPLYASKQPEPDMPTQSANQDEKLSLEDGQELTFQELMLKVRKKTKSRFEIFHPEPGIYSFVVCDLNIGGEDTFPKSFSLIEDDSYGNSWSWNVSWQSNGYIISERYLQVRYLGGLLPPKPTRYGLWTEETYAIAMMQTYETLSERVIAEFMLLVREAGVIIEMLDENSPAESEPPMGSILVKNTPYPLNELSESGVASIVEETCERFPKYDFDVGAYKIGIADQQFSSSHYYSPTNFLFPDRYTLVIEDSEGSVWLLFAFSKEAQTNLQGENQQIYPVRYKGEALPPDPERFGYWVTEAWVIEGQKMLERYSERIVAEFTIELCEDGIATEIK